VAVRRGAGYEQKKNAKKTVKVGDLSKHDPRTVKGGGSFANTTGEVVKAVGTATTTAVRTG
jgi:hypothetical protein